MFGGNLRGRSLGFLLLLFLLLLGAVCARADQTVNIGPSLAFSPSSVTIAPGEKVTWVWMGSPHSTTSSATTGPESWNSGIQLTGATFSHTFTTPGTYPYYCQVHSSPTGTAMNGVIQVVAPTATPVNTPTPVPVTPGPQRLLRLSPPASRFTLHASRRFRSIGICALRTGGPLGRLRPRRPA